MTIRLLYPSDPLNSKLPDEVYSAEFQAAQSHGLSCSLCTLEALNTTQFRINPVVEQGDTVIYRGWMLDRKQYQILYAHIQMLGGFPLTSLEDYIFAHHLPNWYKSVSSYTAETVVVTIKEELEQIVESLSWNEYFVKDFVKSLTTTRGSIAKTPKEVREVVDQIEKYRGKIEGGICLRRVENLKTGTERRYFVFNGCIYGTFQEIPEIISAISLTIDVPFFSIDVAENEDGVLRLIEIGDGQVSDLKEWTPDAFVKIFTNFN